MSYLSKYSGHSKGAIGLSFNDQVKCIFLEPALSDITVTTLVVPFNRIIVASNEALVPSHGMWSLNTILYSPHAGRKCPCTEL